MEHDLSRPFWRSYPTLSRFGWTVAALLLMWPLLAVLLAMCAAFLAIVVVVYPIIHFSWGMSFPGAGDGNE